MHGQRFGESAGGQGPFSLQRLERPQLRGGEAIGPMYILRVRVEGSDDASEAMHDASGVPLGRARVACVPS